MLAADLFDGQFALRLAEDGDDLGFGVDSFGHQSGGEAPTVTLMHVQESGVRPSLVVEAVEAEESTR